MFTNCGSEMCFNINELKSRLSQYFNFVMNYVVINSVIMHTCEITHDIYYYCDKLVCLQNNT